jgi:hypothetical protein
MLHFAKTVVDMQKLALDKSSNLVLFEICQSVEGNFFSFTFGAWSIKRNKYLHLNFLTIKGKLKMKLYKHVFDDGKLKRKMVVIGTYKKCAEPV